MELRDRTVVKVLNGLKLNRGYDFKEETEEYNPSKKVTIRVATSKDQSMVVFFCGTLNPQSIVQLVKPDVEATLKYVFREQNIFDEDGDVTEGLDAGLVRHVIYVVNDRTVTKKSKEFLEPYEKSKVRWEVVFYEDFEFNIMANIFVPKYTLLPVERRPPSSQCLCMKESGRVARIMGAQVGDVLSVSAPNADNGIVTYYRLVVAD